MLLKLLLNIQWVLKLVFQYHASCSGEKIAMMLDSMKGIMAAFKEDRHRVVLGKLEENIHMVEK